VCGPQIAPRRAGSQNPEYAIEHATVIDAGNTAWLVREYWRDDAPFTVAEFIAHDSQLQVGAVESHVAKALKSSSVNLEPMCEQPLAEEE
jgi:hypothetical protein